jgi:DNA repair protein RecO (recombination protein O)
MPSQKTEAIVLSKRDFRETSLIVVLYTRDYGKISGILKGIRKEPGKFASTLEPFSYNDIIFYPKRTSSLCLVSQCELKCNFDAIRRSIEKVCVASVMAELLAVVMPPEDKNEEIFDLMLNCLKELEASPNADKIAMIYKLKLLALSGFKPNFQTCVCCGSRILSDSKFSLALGGLLCMGCVRKDLQSRTIFRGTIASIQHIQKNELRVNMNLGMNPQIKRELDAVLNSFLNFHLERELKSQRVINKLENASIGGNVEGPVPLVGTLLSGGPVPPEGPVPGK